MNAWDVMGVWPREKTSGADMTVIYVAEDSVQSTTATVTNKTMKDGWKMSVGQRGLR